MELAIILVVVIGAMIIFLNRKKDDVKTQAPAPESLPEAPYKVEVQAAPEAAPVETETKPTLRVLESTPEVQEEKTQPVVEESTEEVKPKRKTSTRKSSSKPSVENIEK